MTGAACLTARQDVEWPIALEQGTSAFVDSDPRATLEGVAEVLARRGKHERMLELRDGHATDRIASDLRRWLRSARCAADRA